MKEVFNKIFEIEKTAQKITDEAENEKKLFSEKLKNDFESADSEFEEKLALALKEKREKEQSKADEKIEKLVLKHSEDMKKLKEYFLENKSDWEDEIYKNIIG